MRLNHKYICRSRLFLVLGCRVKKLLVKRIVREKIEQTTNKRKKFGGNGGEVTPLSIPNREVKLTSADGTALETGWESRTLPDINS